MPGTDKTSRVPESQLAWPLYGPGLENLGKEGRPVEWPLPEPAADQLLARVDAAGLCFSDIKIVRQGAAHPRLLGRDLEQEPVILGHETSLTVVAVGEDMRGQYRVGDRFVLQADVYYQGRNLAVGYLIEGALEQYMLLGDEILRGDEGAYLIPLQPATGYAEAALAEPWACVLCAYRQAPRANIRNGGVSWAIGCPGSETKEYGGDWDFTNAIPRRIICTDLPPLVADNLGIMATFGVELCETPPLAEVEVAALAGEEGVDDIFLFQADAEAVERVAPALAKWGVMNIITDQPLERKVSLDVGRIHYDYQWYQGTAGLETMYGYLRPRGPEPLDGGKCWMIGGAGPMGQMHLQLAIERSGGPELLVVTDVDDERLATVPRRFSASVERLGKRLVCLNPTALGEAEFTRRMRELAPDGFDDIVVLVPSPALVEQAAGWLADGGWMNIFAGLARGTMASLDMGAVALRGVRFTGTSGSKIDDLRHAIELTERGELSPNRSVAAIGGLSAARDGLQAVMEGRFAGKIVIYPQIAELELTALDELAGRLPQVAAQLDADGMWTNAAEGELLRSFNTGQV